MKIVGENFMTLYTISHIGKTNQSAFRNVSHVQIHCKLWFQSLNSDFVHKNCQTFANIVHYTDSLHAAPQSRSARTKWTAAELCDHKLKQL